MDATRAGPHAEAVRQAPLAPFVEPGWLGRRSGRPGLRLVDVRDRACYLEGHLPGAVWLDRSVLSVTRADRSVTLLPASPFAARMGQLGVEAGTTVVIYDDVWGMHAARVAWALRRYGHGRAAVLSGGAEGWAASGRPLVRGELLAYPRRFVAEPDEAQRASLAWLQARVGDRSVLLLDVRGEHEYSAERLPDARHWEWSNATPLGGWAALRPAGELRAELLRLGISPDRRIVTYCSSGMRAAHTYLALRSLGYPDVRVLDDAWREYARRDAGAG